MNGTPTLSLSERLPSFFDSFAEIQNETKKPYLSVRLTGFFDGFSACRNKAAAPVIARPSMDVSGLSFFLEGLKAPLEASRRGSFHFDPWEVASLGRNEVRNASVLAWLLNPRGSHGLGIAAMNGLLATVDRLSDHNFSAEPGQFCRIRTEINPNGEISDRVDIEIDAENFYLIIEVKIDAPEQAGQLERYCRQAEARACNRPWAVTFLTTQGRKPNSAGVYTDSGKIHLLSWKKLATALELNLPRRRSTPDQPLALSRQIAEHAARRFLKKIRSF